MRFCTAAWVLFVAGSLASAQAASSGQRVRVLGDTMARQVLTQVAPVYPAIALAKGVTGEVTLYAAVGKDGAVEEVAVVDGPAALQAAASEAVKHWTYKPWLVDGAPVEVDTTVVVDFKGGGEIASGGAAWGPGGVVPGKTLADHGTPLNAARAAAASGASTVAAGGAQARNATTSTVVAPIGKAPAASAVRATTVAAASTGAGSASASGSGSMKTGGVDWEADRRAGAMPLARSSGFMASGGALPGGGSGMQGMVASRPGSGFGGAEGFGTGRGAGSGNRGATEWRLVKKVAPVYPAEAEDAGIEGLVQVAGVVKTDGTLRDLRAVSGPEALRQAAVDAAAQYVFQSVSRGEELDEAPARVPVVFTLTGPAKVAPEVMAGMVLNSFTPPYPTDAVKAGVSGSVKLHVLVGRQGEVKEVKVISGNEMLRQTAVDAVKQWEYRPYRRNGVDVEVETDVLVQFSIVGR